MESKYGFTKMSIDEFEKWIAALKIGRTVFIIQQHHTYSPNYAMFKDNHFELQKGMKNYHVNKNGWADIGQHFSSFPDGTIVTGRSLESSPACIYGANAGSICIEHVGDFDLGKDKMTAKHQDAIIRMNAALCAKFNLPITSNSIIYHHWFNLSTGERNNGSKNNKSCPGTNFFGGNKVKDCETNFLPLINAQLNKSGANLVSTSNSILKYVCVTADLLNVRTKPAVKAPLVKDRDAISLGSILRVYESKKGWYKISSSAEHWVSASYCKDVRRATIKASVLNARSGPGLKFSVLAQLKKGQEVFIDKEEKGWCAMVMDDKWLSKEYLEM